MFDAESDSNNGQGTGHIMLNNQFVYPYQLVDVIEALLSANLSCLSECWFLPLIDVFLICVFRVLVYPSNARHILILIINNLLY